MSLRQPRIFALKGSSLFKNLTSGSISYNEVVMPTLDVMQNMWDYYAGVWFLNHQNKQDLTGENNKTYKGATAFFDSCDETHFVKKRKKRKPPNRNA